MLTATADVVLNWKDIDTIFFDMDGTLIDLHFANYFWSEIVPRAYAKKHQREQDLAQVKQELHAKIMAQRGKLEWYDLMYWQKELELDIVALKHTIVDKVQLLPGAICFMQLAQQKDCELWLTTNAHPKSIAIKFAHSGIAPYFKHVISSHQFAYPKEHPMFWESLQSYQAFDPARVLFLDDSEPVLSAARDYGIEHLLMIAAPDSTQPVNVSSQFQSVLNLQALCD